MSSTLTLQASKNTRWLQVKGVSFDDEDTQLLLKTFGFRWCRHAHHWWGKNDEVNQAMARDRLGLVLATRVETE